MKNICKILCLLGALTLGTTIAWPAGIVDSLRVNVPFSFVVAGKMFPAGQYTVQETDSGVILVRGVGTAAVVLSIPHSPAKLDNFPALRFTASNGQGYLIAVDGQNSSRMIPLPATGTRTLTLSH
jgi:hypothetical protein